MARVYDAKSAPPFATDYTIVRHDVLQWTNMQDNMNKFYSLELHEGGGKWRIFTHYGFVSRRSFLFATRTRGGIRSCADAACAHRDRALLPFASPVAALFATWRVENRRRTRRRTDDLIKNDKAGRFEVRMFDSLPAAKGAYNDIVAEKTQKKVGFVVARFVAR